MTHTPESIHDIVNVSAHLDTHTLEIFDPMLMWVAHCPFIFIESIELLKLDLLINLIN